MKRVIFLLSLLMLLGCKSKNVIQKPIEANIIKLTLSLIDEKQKSKTLEIGKRVLMTCNISKFKPFNSSEATPSVIKNMTQDRLTKTCLKFRLKYGDFKDLQLVEAFKNNEDKNVIFRYKALYEKKIANKELRIFLNEKNQVSAIKSFDWVDTFTNK
ncbi:hypothetical protein [Flavobacterium psychrotolerans]|uniref:Lipoprotein n=1 Tax=Flavobacterium psychrotolerans TaxID=2169410 RepID=A0A2U1JH12_9FLAO|nr:hypothetical protein [Flavobacterium psychrotolerans]PWA04228.1 hypothetical protein DB895_12085 [Flavobacterium psychrotolerans]